jgi:hypothetical protein
VIYGRRYMPELGHRFAVAATDEVLVARPENGQIALVFITATAPMGEVNAWATLKDGKTPIGTWSVPGGDTKTLIFAPSGVPIIGDLVAQVSATTVTVSAWVIEVGRGA